MMTLYMLPTCGDYDWFPVMSLDDDAVHVTYLW